MHSTSISAHARQTKNGFTLIEMMVVLAILGIVGYSAYYTTAGSRKSTVLNGAANQVVALLRLAQSSGYSGLADSNGTFSNGYGAHFDMGTTDRIVYFSDKNSNQLYEGNATPTEKQSTLFLPNGVTMSQVCLTPSSGADVCTSVSGSGAEVIFKRSSTDPVIYSFPAPNVAYNEAKIYLTAGGAQKIIRVTHTGKIAIE